MRYLDMENWPRREHYELFGSMNHPHVGLCANVDVTALHAFVKQHGLSFSIAIMYLLARVANAIPAFRQRIRDDKVVEHDSVDLGYTILVDNNLFSFSVIAYTANFSEFAKRASEQSARAKEQPDLHIMLAELGDRDDLLYTSVIPWVSFTGFLHPMPLHPADSIPRFAIGKFFGDERLLQMPLAVQGHHGLVDGLHIGRFYEQMQDLLSHPEGALAG
jgi:chloramphenicol O-acetyltransferase type A